MPLSLEGRFWRECAGSAGSETASSMVFWSDGDPHTSPGSTTSCAHGAPTADAHGEPGERGCHGAIRLPDRRVSVDAWERYVHRPHRSEGGVSHRGGEPRLVRVSTLRRCPPLRRRTRGYRRGAGNTKFPSRNSPDVPTTALEMTRRRHRGRCCVCGVAPLDRHFGGSAPEGCHTGFAQPPDRPRGSRWVR